MNYNGGKSYTIARHGMGAFWEACLGPEVRRFVDVFAGSGAVAAHVRRIRPFLPVVCNDAHPAAAALLRAAATPWRPPPTLSEDDYVALRERSRAGDASPDVAFAGFGASFGGKYYGGFARPHARQRDKAAASARAWSADAEVLAAVKVEGLDYAALPGAIGIEPGDLWYADKPYRGTTGYVGLPKFDHDAFWAWAADLSRIVPVLVSEFAAPAGWREVWSVTRKLESRGGERTDRIFTFG